MEMNRITKLILFSMLVILLVIVSACSSNDDSSKNQSYDLITNPDGSSYFKVINNLYTGLAWNFTSGFACGADMKPGECVDKGLPES